MSISCPWLDSGKRYYPLSLYLRQVFGGPVRKISVDAGFGCPNRDGTLGRGGCVFCDPKSYSPSLRFGGGKTIAEQIGEAVGRRENRGDNPRLLAYFQPGTNTYASPERLRAAYLEALRQPAVVGLIVGTRPDCVDDAVLDVLAEVASQAWLTVEFGFQSIHEASLAWMRRGHGHEQSRAAVEKCRERGLRVGAHVILGLPGESSEMMQATAREMARLKIDAVKLHNLHAVKGTELAEMVTTGNVVLPTESEYVGWAVDFLERLHPGCVIERLCGNAPPEYLVAPAWCLRKSQVLAAIDAEFRRRGTHQGAFWGQ